MWLDTIPPLDTISLNKNWTNDEALIYSHFWVINENTSEKGYWKEVTTNNKYYVGFRIPEDEGTLYGWIGMKRDPATSSKCFMPTDYTILKNMKNR